MQVASLIGAKNGVNTVFTVAAPGPGVGHVFIVWGQRLLKQVTGSPGPYEYVRAGTVTFTLGSAPGPPDMLFAYVQTDASLALAETPLTGIQNNLNVTFRLAAAPTGGLLLFRNGALLEPSATIPNAVQYQVLGTSGQLQLGLAPGPTDVLRAFVAGPAGAAIQAVAFTGAQDGANTRYRLAYQPPPGSEPILMTIVDGWLQTRTLERPGLNQYALVATNEVMFGAAPGPQTSAQFVLIGNLVVTTSPYSFTLDRLARRVGIFTQRKLDQLETREIVSQVYAEMINAYQWSFLHTDGAFATEGLKTDGTVTVTAGSQVIVGSGTTFGAADVGKTLRVNGANTGYTVLNVEAATQRVTIDPPYVDVTAAAQQYMLYRHVYPLPMGVEYVFTMTGQYAMGEVPRTVLDHIDPLRSSTADVPQKYAYAGRAADGRVLVELYPIPSAPAVIRFTGIRTDALTDPQQRLKGIDSLILNCAAAGACRVIATKEGEEKRGPTWLALAEIYDRKADGLLQRLDSLDLTRSDVAKVQGMRGESTDDGWYDATHDTWMEDLW